MGADSNVAQRLMDANERSRSQGTDCAQAKLDKSKQQTGVAPN